jgi:ABC-type polysaccharide/polyol phosphate export permease
LETASASPGDTAERTGFPPPNRFHEALRDIIGGLRLMHVWGLLGAHDIKQRYRRSTFGPFWLTLSMAIMIATIGILYARLFNQDMSSYLPFLAVGLLLWTFISTGMNELCAAFTAAESMIKQVKLPLTVHVSRVVWRNLLILAHNAIILIPVALWSGNIAVVPALTALVGIFLLGVNALWFGLTMGILCARFRDIPPIVNSMTQIVFFLTPILWKPESLGSRIWLAKINPLFHFVEVVRVPILHGTIPLTSWAVCVVISVVLGLISIVVLARFGRRVAYWL